MNAHNMLIHLHPEFSADCRAEAVNEVMGCNGEFAALFAHHAHSHGLVTVYNPETISSQTIFSTAPKCDSSDAMASF